MYSSATSAPDNGATTGLAQPHAKPTPIAEPIERTPRAVKRTSTSELLEIEAAATAVHKAKAARNFAPPPNANGPNKAAAAPAATAPAAAAPAVAAPAAAACPAFRGQHRRHTCDNAGKWGGPKGSVKNEKNGLSAPASASATSAVSGTDSDCSSATVPKLMAHATLYQLPERGESIVMAIDSGRDIAAPSSARAGVEEILHSDGASKTCAIRVTGSGGGDAAAVATETGDEGLRQFTFEYAHAGVDWCGAGQELSRAQVRAEDARDDDESVEGASRATAKTPLNFRRALATLRASLRTEESGIAALGVLPVAAQASAPQNPSVSSLAREHAEATSSLEQSRCDNCQQLHGGAFGSGRICNQPCMLEASRQHRAPTASARLPTSLHKPRGRVGSVSSKLGRPRKVIRGSDGSDGRAIFDKPPNSVVVGDPKDRRPFHFSGIFMAASPYFPQNFLWPVRVLSTAEVSALPREVREEIYRCASFCSPPFFWLSQPPSPP